MAEPSYATDLVEIDYCESGGKVWAEPTASGWTYGAAPSLDGENFIQGSGAMSKAFNAVGVGGMMVNHGGAISLPTDGAIFGWLYWASPKTLNTDALGGMRMMAGSSLANFDSWDVSGSTTYVYGGWVNFAINTTIAYDDRAGQGLGNSQYIGAAFWNLDAIIKGNPCLVDAFRYGRGESRFAAGGGGDAYATFSGFAAVNDAPTARWGLIQAIPGGYLVKGLVIFGYGGAVDFRDANKSLVIQNTNKVTANFNTFEVRNASSRVDLTAISIMALGTVSKGRWVTTDNAIQNITNCVFTDMGVFGYASNSTIIGTTFRRCGLVTQNSAILDLCNFEATSDPAKALLSNNPSSITDCNFVSSGSGHAIEINTPGEYTLNNYYSDYGATGTANAVIYNNSGGYVKLNIGTGYDIPTYLNGPEETSTDIITQTKTYAFTVKDEAGAPVTHYEWRLYIFDPTPGYHGEEIPGTGSEDEPLSGRSYVYTYGGDVKIVLQILHDDYIEYVLEDTLEDQNKSVSVILRKEVNI